MVKKILAITGIRSDYDLMSPVFRLLHADPNCDLRLLVGGAHLSMSYGFTVKQIEKDGFVVLQKIESLLDTESVSGKLKSASIFLQGAIDPVSMWSPDLIIYAGDREEVMIGALLGTYLEIPTVHFYGGDHTMSGHVDNPIRHATSKLSTVHAVTLEEHRLRLIKTGETAERIYLIGNMALDNFLESPNLTSVQLEATIGLPRGFKNYAMVIFHPDPSEREIASQIIESILIVLKQRGIPACVGYPNTDPANFGVIKMIESFSHDDNFFIYRNLGRVEFISLYKNARLIIGNSSSGILEAASIPIPAVNVGLRQRGRTCGRNVIFCDADFASIEQAVVKATDPVFLESLAGLANPYGVGDSSQLAHRLLMDNDFDKIRLKTEDALGSVDEMCL